MTEDKSIFTSLSPKDGGFITFRDNNKGKIISIGNVGNKPSLIIENILLIDGLKHNLLTISQLCDKRNRIIFDKDNCTIEVPKMTKSYLLIIELIMYIFLKLTMLNQPMELFYQL